MHVLLHVHTKLFNPKKLLYTKVCHTKSKLHCMLVLGGIQEACWSQQKPKTYNNVWEDSYVGLNEAYTLPNADYRHTTLVTSLPTLCHP